MAGPPSNLKTFSERVSFLPRYTKEGAGCLQHMQIYLNNRLCFLLKSDKILLLL